MTATTPVPNKLFDFCLKDLQGAELKVLLIVTRQTLGWQDRRMERGRKELDWISSSQFIEKSGCSRRAITVAIDSLVRNFLIRVYDCNGNLLQHPSSRKGKHRLFYCLAPTLLSTVDNVVITQELPVEKEITYAINAEGLRTNVTALAQKMRITK